MHPPARFLFVGGLLAVLGGCTDAAPTGPELNLKSSSVGSAHGIAPPQSHPRGKSYSEWAAAFWQWLLAIPPGTNPLLDPTSGCDVAQSGHVWFLVGTFGPQTVDRTCTVPTGTAFLFPLINNAFFAFLNDPPEQRTEEFLRAQVTCVEGTEFPVVEVDGKPVPTPHDYLEQSVVFKVILPEDNIFGVTEEQVPELTLFPSVDEGFYLFLNPLPPGSHTIHFQVKATGCGSEAVADVTYRLNVAPGRP
jgi:hypothetical protein